MPFTPHLAVQTWTDWLPAYGTRAGWAYLVPGGLVVGAGVHTDLVPFLQHSLGLVCGLKVHQACSQLLSISHFHPCFQDSAFMHCIMLRLHTGQGQARQLQVRGYRSNAKACACMQVQPHKRQAGHQQYLCRCCQRFAHPPPQNRPLGPHRGRWAPAQRSSSARLCPYRTTARGNLHPGPPAWQHRQGFRPSMHGMEAHCVSGPT